MPPEYPQLTLDNQLCFPLYATSRALTRAYAPLLAGTGLTYPQYLTMLALWDEHPQAVSRLGERLHLDSGTLTPLLKRLETQGYVVRRRDRTDERRVLVEPTERGWALRDQVADVPERLFGSLGLSARDHRELRRILGTLQRSLDAQDPAAP